MNKIVKVKINSSVVKLHLFVIAVSIIASLVAFMTAHQDLAAAVLSPWQLVLYNVVISTMTIVLRNTHIQGLKPIEIVRASDDTPVDVPSIGATSDQPSTDSEEKATDPDQPTEQK